MNNPTFVRAIVLGRHLGLSLTWLAWACAGHVTQTSLAQQPDLAERARAAMMPRGVKRGREDESKEDEPKAKKPKNLKKPFAANEDTVRASDSALQGGFDGIGLIHYKPLAPVTLLRKGATRYNFTLVSFHIQTPRVARTHETKRFPGWGS